MSSFERVGRKLADILALYTMMNESQRKGMESDIDSFLNNQQNKFEKERFDDAN